MKTQEFQNKLAEYAKDFTSQNGEDGILKKIFDTLQIEQGWCVEFGAWDGKKFSNTYNLTKNYSWSGVMIEANSSRFQDLLKTYHENENVICLNKFVAFEGKCNLDSILSETPIPSEFDLLSIDIDGNDYHIWESLNKYQPKVVIIEYNFTIPNSVDFVQPRDMTLNQGNSLKALIRLGKEKGYELVATTKTNAIFVKENYYNLFEIEDNDINRMRETSEYETQLFQLYDGTIILKGNQKLLWSSTPINENKIQVFPKFLRYFESSNPIKNFLKKLWRLIYTRT